MLVPRIVTSLSLIVLLAASATGQVKHETVRSVETMPAEHMGTWIIGGEEYIAHTGTELDFDNGVPTVGGLVEIEYFDTDEGRVLDEIETREAHDVDAIHDGPFVWFTEDGATVTTVAKGDITTRPVARDTDVVIRGPLGHDITVDANPTTPPASFPAAERLFIVSDVEGEFDALVKMLAGNGVIDTEARWSFGEGHLVFVGDVVDRGPHVTKVLWLIYGLQREAERAGGHVTLVLGNHEVMTIGGVNVYAPIQAHAAADLVGRDYAQLFGVDTALGRWLRTRNAIVRVGDILFVHAGVAPKLDLPDDLTAVNTMLRKGFGKNPRALGRDDYELLWGRQSLLWYRGMFPGSENKYGARPTSEELTERFARWGSKALVVGHTRVARVQRLYDEPLVLAIDVPWSDAADTRGVFVENNTAYSVDAHGSRTEVATLHATQP